MTPKELIRLLEKHNISAYHLSCPVAVQVPKSFVPSEETREMQDRYKRTQEAYYGHPLHKKSYREQSADTRQSREFKQMRQDLVQLSCGGEEAINEWLDSVGIGGFELVDNTRGEGEDGPISKVVRFVTHDIFLRITGRNDSYNGDVWDEEIEEVVPVEKTMTVFEKR